MVYSVCMCLFVLFAMLGLASVCYLLLITIRKPIRCFKSVIVLPMCSNNKENIRRIEYAFERIHLFGENENIQIIAVRPDDDSIKETEKVFEGYSSVYFAYLRDLPQVMSCSSDR